MQSWSRTRFAGLIQLVDDLHIIFRTRRSDSDGAAHVLAATHRGFDFAVAVGTFGNLYIIAVVELEAVIFQRCVAFSASRVDAHAAFFTLIGRHISSPFLDQKLNLRAQPINQFAQRASGFVVSPFGPSA